MDNLTSTNNVLVFHDHPDIDKIISDFELSNEMKKALEKVDTTKVCWPEYSFVARDPKFDNTADNQYISVIGSLTKK